MAKRKRSEQTGPTKQIQQDGVGRKAKVQRVVSSKEKASDKIASLKQKSSSLSENSKPNALRIVIGSYEKVLCGIDARFTSSNAGNNDLVLNPVYMFSAHTGAIKCLAANERYLVSGGSDEVIKIYDLKKRKDLGSLVQHNGAITALQFYSKNHLLSASEDGTICIWRTRDWECMATMKGHKGRVNGLSVHPTGKIAISVGKDRALRLWNLMTGRKASANKIGEEAFDVKWNKAGDHYAILFDRKVIIYNMNAEPQATLEHRVRVHCIRYFEHPVYGEVLALGTDDKLIQFHSTSDGKLLQEVKGHRARVKAIDVITMSHGEDILLLASASSDGEAKTWVFNKDGVISENGSFDTGNRLLCMALHDAAIEQLDLLPLTKKQDESDYSSSSGEGEDNEGSEDEEEWHGIED